jgi:hypothetical protein
MPPPPESLDPVTTPKFSSWYYVPRTNVVSATYNDYFQGKKVLDGTITYQALNVDFDYSNSRETGFFDPGHPMIIDMPTATKNDIDNELMGVV